MNPLLQRKPTILPLLIALVLGALAFVSQMLAVSPPPDGCYPELTTAEGCFALFSLAAGQGNTAIGHDALFSDTEGSFNTGVGAVALALNDGNFNAAVGVAGLLLNTTGHHNTAVGAAALVNNGSGSENTAVGAGAGPNIILGVNNTYVGDFVGTLSPDESSTIRIGDLSNGNGAGSLACFIGGIFNNFQPVGGSVVEVTLDLNNDELGWDLGPNQGGSAPVQRSAPLPRARPQRQHQAMLNDKVEKLEATVAQQQKQIEALTSALQKVSAQLELSKPAQQTVKNTN